MARERKVHGVLKGDKRMGVVEILDPQLQIMAYFGGFQRTTTKIKVKMTFSTLEAEALCDALVAEVAGVSAIPLEGERMVVLVNWVAVATFFWEFKAGLVEK